MKNELIVRQALPEDAEQLALLAKNNMPGYPFVSIYDPSALREEIKSGSHRIVALDKEQNIHGTAVLGDEHMAEIKRVLVAKNSRGQGIAKALTTRLKIDSQNLSKIPWADVRADQVGMQRAAHSDEYMSLVPVSIELGKHIVYEHYDGPARESMIHMSGLDIAKNKSGMTDQLGNYSSILVHNMTSALEESRAKDVELVTKLIPSADLVSRQIKKSIQGSVLTPKLLSEDILAIEYLDAKGIIIAPDASGFVEGSDANSILKLVDLCLEHGLQIVTCYVSTLNENLTKRLINCGMQPVMIRPWQETPTSKPEWQVGLRKTANDFDQSLHHIKLDSEVREELLEIIKNIDSITRIWKGI